MNPISKEHPFKVGERYENRKGIFEVISIDGNEMTIRWDTGEFTSTPIDLQARILRNMEKELAVPTSKKGFRPPKSHGEFFSGLRPDDFSVDVTGTGWRAREQLGGAVTRGLDVSEPFDSWSIYKRPEVHWASVARYRLVSPLFQTKYFVRVDEVAVRYGLYIERSNDANGIQDDWRRFVAWTQKSENCLWLHNLLASQEAVLSNPYQDAPDLAFYGKVVALDNGVFDHRLDDESSSFPATELPNFLERLPKDRWLNFFIERQMYKEEAMKRGPEVASVISTFFNNLLPIYSFEAKSQT